jgi:hypothetical protein
VSPVLEDQTHVFMELVSTVLVLLPVIVVSDTPEPCVKHRLITVLLEQVPAPVFMEPATMELDFIHVPALQDIREPSVKHKSTIALPVLEDQIHVFTVLAIIRSVLLIVRAQLVILEPCVKRKSTIVLPVLEDQIHVFTEFVIMV